MGCGPSVLGHRDRRREKDVAERDGNGGSAGSGDREPLGGQGHPTDSCGPTESQHSTADDSSIGPAQDIKKRRKSIILRNDGVVSVKPQIIHGKRNYLESEEPETRVLGQSYVGTVTAEGITTLCVIKEILVDQPVVQLAAVGAGCAPAAVLNDLADYLLQLRPLQHENLVDLLLVRNLPPVLSVASAVVGQVPPPSNSAVNLVGRITNDQLTALLRDVIDGVSRLHAHQLSHGNIKASNVVFDEDSHQYVLCDGGYGKLLNYVSRESLFDELHVRDQAFFPPESLPRHGKERSFDAPNGGNRVSFFDDTQVRVTSQKADIWAVGVLAFTLIFGHPPFQEGDREDVFRRIAEMAPVIPMQFSRPGFQMNRNLHSLLHTLLEKDPATRPEANGCLRHVFFRRPREFSCRELLPHGDDSSSGPRPLPADEEEHVLRAASWHSRGDLGLVEDVCVVTEDLPCINCLGSLAPLAFQCTRCPQFVICSACYRHQQYKHDPTHQFMNVVVEEMNDRKMSVSLGVLNTTALLSNTVVEAVAGVTTLLSKAALDEVVEEDGEEDTDSEHAVSSPTSNSGSALQTALKPASSTNKQLVLVNANLLSPSERSHFGVTGQLPEARLSALKSPLMSNRPASYGQLPKGDRDGGESPPPSGAQASQKKGLCGLAPEDEYSVEEIIEDAVRGDKRLMLNSMKLTVVPETVYQPQLLHLTDLDLSSNSLTEIPDGIGSLTRLTKLSFGNNKLRSIPEAIGDLTELHMLELQHNQLEELPQTLMFAEQLEELTLDYNNFEKVPQVVFDIPSLRTIFIASNTRIKQWPSTEDLKALGECKIGIDNEPHLWAKWPSMERVLPQIQIQWNKIYPDMIIQNMYCGSLRSAQTPIVYEALRIKHVLSMGRHLAPVVLPGMQHMSINVDDIENANVEETFESAVAFIDNALSKGEGCLVHCFAGMSRSATACIAYLMIKRGMRLDEAYVATKRGRPAIYPNQGFFAQLQRLDTRLFPGARPLDIESMERQNVPMG